MGEYEWTISRSSSSSDGAIYVRNSGSVANVNVNSGREIRPSFFLSSSTMYESGVGTMEEPIRIS